MSGAQKLTHSSFSYASFSYYLLLVCYSVSICFLWTPLSDFKQQGWITPDFSFHKHHQGLTFCIYPENLSAVEEMEFLTLLSRSFFTSGHEVSFLASKCAKRLKNKTGPKEQSVMLGKENTYNICSWGFCEVTTYGQLGKMACVLAPGLGTAISQLSLCGCGCSTHMNACIAWADHKIHGLTSWFGPTSKWCNTHRVCIYNSSFSP